jgi:hypothetical protein
MGLGKLSMAPIAIPSAPPLHVRRRMVKLKDMNVTYYLEPTPGAPRRDIAGSSVTARDIAYAGAVIAALVNLNSADGALAHIDY